VFNKLKKIPHISFSINFLKSNGSASFIFPDYYPQNEFSYGKSGDLIKICGIYYEIIYTHRGKLITFYGDSIISTGVSYKKGSQESEYLSAFKEFIAQWNLLHPVLSFKKFNPNVLEIKLATTEKSKFKSKSIFNKICNLIGI